MSFGRMTILSTCVVITALTFGVIAKPPQKIVNGTYAYKNEFPFMVSLRYADNFQFCGGSIISRSHILTAAHCVIDVTVDQIIAVTGTNKWGSDGVSHDISKIITHPHYSDNDPSLHNDIAVLTLTWPLRMDSKFSWQIIHLASKDYGPGFPAITMGFGRTAYGDKVPTSTYLLKINTKLADINSCQNFRHKPNRRDHLCTLPKNRQGTCQGDSGGPLIVRGEVVGIVSYSYDCGVNPSVYTKVFRYLDFIKEATQATYLGNTN